MPEGHNFKRINFFEGFFTTDEDWNAAEAYHLEKRRLHNRIMHQAGVVPIVAGGLKVTSRGKGDLSFEVAPGYAVDGRGNELVLRDPAVKVIEADKLKLPATVYVGIRYYEEPTDFIAYKENPRFKGHRRIEEKCRVEVLPKPPDNEETIELARVKLEEGVREIREAADARAPGPGELDLRYVPLAGIAGAHAVPAQRVELSVGLNDLQHHAAALAKAGVATAQYVRHQAAAAEMLNTANALGPGNLAEVLGAVVELERDMVDEIEKVHPNIASRKQFNDYKKSLEALHKLVRDRPRDVEGCGGIVRFLTSANQSLLAVTKEKQGPVAKGPEAIGEKLAWKDINVYSRDFPQALNIEGSNFTLMDSIEFVDESMKNHRWVVEGSKEMFPSRQEFTYPDGTKVAARGISYTGGQAKFNALNLKPNRDLIIIKRYDAVYGEQQTEMSVDGKKVTVWKTPEADRDRKHRWRNHYYHVPGTNVSGETIEIVKKALAAERDINIFKLWFYQPA